MVCVELGKPLELHDLPMPKPSSNGVVVKVEACGLCHSDLFHAKGHVKGTETPFVPGHEIAGTVHEIGHEVHGLSVGEKVLVYPVFTCGVCKACATGAEYNCDDWYPIGWRIDGKGVDGGFAEYVHVPNFRNVLKIGELNPEEAAPLACAGLTALHAIYEAQIRSDDFLVLIGIGGLGHFALQLAKKLRGASVIAIDVNDEKLSFASKLGADYTVNSMKEDPVAFIRSISKRGVDAVIDFVGTPKTFEMASKMLGRGGRHVIAGIYGAGQTVLVPLSPLLGPLIGCFMGARRHLMELISLCRRNVIKPRISSRFKLVEANEAWEKLENGEIEGRAILKP